MVAIRRSRTPPPRASGGIRPRAVSGLAALPVAALRGRPPRSAELERQRRQVTRQAEEIFARHGYRGTTMRAVAARARCSVGQIYKLYPSKLELYRAVFVAKTEEIDRQIEEVTRTGRGAIENLREQTRTALAFFQEHRAFFRIYNLEIGSRLVQGKSPMASRITRVHEEAHRRIVRLLAEGQREGTIRADLDLETTAISLVAMVMGHAEEWTLSRSGAPLVDRAGPILDLICRGVMEARPGGETRG